MVGSFPPSPLVALRLQSLLGRWEPTLLWNHYTHQHPKRRMKSSVIASVRLCYADALACPVPTKIVLAPEVHISKMILLRTATRGLAPQGNSSLHVVAGPIVISGEHTALAYVMGECKQTFWQVRDLDQGPTNQKYRECTTDDAQSLFLKWGLCAGPKWTLLSYVSETGKR